jgi:hypothetical protein
MLMLLSTLVAQFNLIYQRMLSSAWQIKKTSKNGQTMRYNRTAQRTETEAQQAHVSE